jgi:hypothetical protein
MWADSIMLSGSVRIYVLITTKLKALTIPGMTYTQKELIKPSFSIKKYVGVSPAFTYMESFKINVKGFRKRNSFLESTKAIIAVKNTLVAILMAVLATEIKKAWGMAPVWKITL